MREVTLSARSMEDLAAVIPQERLDRLANVSAPRMRELLAGHSIINVNSTDKGGGVAEMLHVLLPLVLGLGLSTKWFVVEGDPVFFSLTKRVHHRLHGSQGDDGELTAVERGLMSGVVAKNAPELLNQITPGDVVILHDPQPAPLAAMLAERGIPVIWRCHVGVDKDNDQTLEAWRFLEPFLSGIADEYVFTRSAYAPDWVPPDELHVIKPSIDPLAPKNQDLGEADVLGALGQAGIVAGEPVPGAGFTRNNGTSSPFDLKARIIRSGPAPGPDVPLVVQVSRWDPLKDMAGVMRGFVETIAPATNAHLALVGPDVAGVSDDPEGQSVLDAIADEWRELPHDVRDRIHLVSLPMDDPEQNGAVVNAVQRHAAVVVQKSLAEGFGLTVTEAMFKGRPVVASAVGGIVDQIDDQVNGVLVSDPRDLVAFGQAVVRVLQDPTWAAQLGAHARQRAIDVFLPDTSLDLWTDTVVAAMERHS